MGKRIRRREPRAHRVLVVLAMAVLLAELSLTAYVTGVGGERHGPLRDAHPEPGPAVVTGGAAVQRPDARDGLRPGAALDRLIPSLQARGHRFVTASAGLRRPATPAAPTGPKARGPALRAARTVGGWFAGALTGLMVLAVVLAGLRLLAQLVTARIHLRRTRRTGAATAHVEAAAPRPDPARDATGRPGTRPHPGDPYRAAPCRAEPHRAAPYHAAPYRAEPHRADPYRRDPYHAGPRRPPETPPTVTPGRPGHAHTGSAGSRSHWPTN